MNLVGSHGANSERRRLRAGPLTATLESGGLRWISWEGVEVLRGVYAAVRDRAWGTIEPSLRDLRVDEYLNGFEVTFRAVHENREVAFDWLGRIIGKGDGSLLFTLDGSAKRTFLRSRIGFCVLHPMSIEGQRLTVQTSTQSIEGAFPSRIAPQNPFTDIVAMRWPPGTGLEASLRFDGDFFEMEDQRNWTDASYKTFCTPLSFPHPVKVDPGTRLRQAVELSVRGKVRRRPAASPPRIQVSAEALGPLPMVGFAIPPGSRPPDMMTVRRLVALRPDHLRVSIAHGSRDWIAQLAGAADEARRIDAPLEIEATVADDGEGADEVVQALMDHSVRIARLLVFPSGAFASTQPVIEAGRRALVTAKRSWRLGGGSRANFLELNRAALPAGMLDVAAYPINPQVHAFDEASIVETLAAQTTTIRDAKQICRSVPLSIGPVTLKPRFNSALPPGDIGAEPDDSYPARVDDRQASLFAAAWTVGSIASLARPGVAALTFFETTGMAGLMLTDRDAVHPLFGNPDGRLFPLYHVFAALRMDADTHLVASKGPSSAVVLGLRAGRHLRVLVANLTDSSQVVEIDLPAGTDMPLARVLDESTFPQALDDHEAMARLEAQELGDRPAIHLGPWAIARIDARLRRQGNERAGSAMRPTRVISH